MKKKLEEREYLYSQLKKIWLMMRLSIFLILFTMASVSASVYSQNTRLTLKMKNSRIADVFDAIEQQSEFYFFYNRDQFDDNRIVQIDIQNKSILEVLDKLFEDEPISYEIVDRNILIKVDDVGFKSGQQKKTVKGTVVDSSSSLLPGVSIVIKGTTTGAITDLDGNFTLSNVSDDATLIFSFVGMKTQEVVVAGQTSFNIVMEEDAIGLDEVVAIGYGTMKKSDLTGSVVSVKEDIIVDRPLQSVSQALIGQLAGVRVSQNNATPGGETSIKIRGIGSITAGNEPLYVIDGIPTDQGFANAILPTDIESVEVLKDASSTAIYGSRGANGVILITTKSGNAQKPTIQFTTSYGLASVAKRDYYDLLSGEEYNQYAIELRNNQWVRAGVGNSPSDPNSVRPAQYQIPDELRTWNGVNTDWQDAIFEVANIENYNMSIRGGTEKTKYFFSTGYSGDDGVLIGTGFSKYNARIKVDSELIDNKLNVGMNLAPSYSKQRVALGDAQSIYLSSIASALAMPPTIPVYNEDGSYADRMKPIAGFLPIPNPVNLANDIQNRTTRFNTLFNVYAELKLMEDLTVRSSFGSTFSFSRNEQYHPSTAPRFWAPTPVNASGSYSTNDRLNWLSETTVSYKEQIGNHGLNFVGGLSFQKDQYFNSWMNANNFPNDLVHTLNAGEIQNGSTFKQEWSLISYFGRVNYNFKDKYLATVTVRTDGSSRFGENVKWVFFPSAAFAWRVSQEDFLKDSRIINNLKLRASYGVTGNNSIGNYAHIGLLGQTNQTFGPGAGSNYVGIFPSSISNPDLTWEISEQIDLGFDLSILDSRINLTVDYYENITSDLLLNVNLPTTTGFSGVLQNIGEVENKGYEIVLNTVNLRGNLKWNTTFNISHNKNKVLKLGPTGDPIYGFHGLRITEVGGPIGASRGLVQIGVLTQADIDSGVAIFPGQTAGDTKYLDVNKDGKISGFNGDDGISIGDSNPEFVFGFNNKFNYKNIDLNIMITGQAGGKTMDLTSQGLWDPDGSNVMRKQWEGRYVSDAQPGNGSTPRAGMILGGMPDTRLVQKTDYLRISNITLGYTLPKSKIPFASSARLYGSVENLITFTDFEGFNPQATSWGGSQNVLVNGLTGGGSYPLPRIVSLGLNLTF